MYAVNGKKLRIILQKNSLMLISTGLLGYELKGVPFATMRLNINFSYIRELELILPGSIGYGFLKITLNEPAQKGILNDYEVKRVYFKKSEKDYFLELYVYIDSMLKSEPIDFDTLKIPTLAYVEAIDNNLRVKAKRIKRIVINIIALAVGAYTFWKLSSDFSLFQ